MTKQQLHLISKFIGKKVDNRKIKNWNLAMEVVERIHALEVGLRNGDVIFRFRITDCICEVILTVESIYTTIKEDWIVAGGDTTLKAVWNAINELMDWLELPLKAKELDLLDLSYN